MVVSAGSTSGSVGSASKSVVAVHIQFGVVQSTTSSILINRVLLVLQMNKQVR
jgi:hypothetical protein